MHYRGENVPLVYPREHTIYYVLQNVFKRVRVSVKTVLPIIVNAFLTLKRTLCSNKFRVKSSAKKVDCKKLTLDYARESYEWRAGEKKNKKISQEHFGSAVRHRWRAFPAFVRDTFSGGVFAQKAST